MAVLVPKEWQEQQCFCQFLDQLPEPWRDSYFAVPNDGKRGWVAQRQYKALGGKAGVPDLVIAVPRGPYAGLFLEFKRLKGSTTTPEQLAWQATLRRNGYKAEIVKGFDGAMEVFSAYRNLPVRRSRGRDA